MRANSASKSWQKITWVTPVQAICCYYLRKKYFLDDIKFDVIAQQWSIKKKKTPDEFNFL